MRRLAALEEFVLARLLAVQDPVLRLPLSELRWIRGPYVSQDDHDVVFVRLTLRVPTLLHPGLHALRATLTREALAAARAFEQQQDDYRPPTTTRYDVHVHTQAGPPLLRASKGETDADREKRLGPGLGKVAHFVAVYSCKGGVGKSTVATNLAYALAHKGGRVGLMDADVYGPSLPVMVRPSDPMVRRSDVGVGMVKPITHEGVELISLGYVSPKSGVPGSGGADNSSGAAVIRGPMASKVVTQLLKGTEWGELDVLLIDLPPGTGDVQLSVCQHLQLDGAVSVTTPSQLAITDAKKGIEMFDALGIPTMVIVENMAYFECEGGGRHYPFGKGIDLRSLFPAETMENNDVILPPVIQMPISEFANGANDEGIPMTLSRSPDAQTEVDVFDNLADEVSKELLLQQYAALSERVAVAAGNNDNNNSSSGNNRNNTVGSSSSKSPKITIRGEEWEISSLRLTADTSKESFVVRLFSDSGAMEATIFGEDLRFTHPRTGLPMEDATAASVIVKRGGGGGGCGSSSGGPSGHDHSHDHAAAADAGNGIVQQHQAGGAASTSSVKPRKLARRLFPVTVEKRGNYGYAVEWADGATIIYTMTSIAHAAAKTEPSLHG